MADLSGSHFEYGGISSREYGLIIANAETQRYTGLSGSIKGTVVYNKKNQRRYLIDDDYSDFPLSFDIEIIKDNEQCIEYNIRRKIEKWLFNRSRYQKLYIDQGDDWFSETTEFVDGEQKRLYLNCRFINPERLEYNGGTVGYKVTLEADSGMWWQDPIKKTVMINNTNTTDTEQVCIVTDSDMDDYIYPTIKIYGGIQSGTVTLINHSDDENRETAVYLFSGSTVTIDSEINYVSGGQYTAMSKRNFPRLLDGENNLTVTGSVEKIEVTFQNRRSF